MSFDAQRLYELLPAIYRIRDTERGGPLDALIGVVADQIALLQDDLTQLYDDQFIETCAPWVIPYIGDLIGYRPLNSFDSGVSNVGRPRAEVAHTIAFRRRKGTATMLEQLARDVTGWNARVVEFFQLMSWTQHMNHLRPQCRYSPHLRQRETLERLAGAFDTVAHTVDVRNADLGAKYNVHNVGIYLWRLDAYSLTSSPAAPAVAGGGDMKRFFFDPLGNSQPLFTLPAPDLAIDQAANPLDVPEPISRLALEARLSQYYGIGKSLSIEGVDVGDVKSCNLADAIPAGTGWGHVPSSGVAIDPVLGRIAFATAQTSAPRVTFHHGFAAPIGGGEFPRSATFDAKLPLLATVPLRAATPTSVATVQAALDKIANFGAAELSDSGRYEEALTIKLPAEGQIELRAADGSRPLIALLAPLEIQGGSGSTVTISGLLISGQAIQVSQVSGNQLQLLRIIDCTLVPMADASLIVDVPGTLVKIERSIVGSLRIAPGATIEIIDSIVDAGDITAVAYSAADSISPGGALTLRQCSVFGKLHTEELSLASNSLLLAELAPGDRWLNPGGPGAAVRADRRQAGCVRFSYVPQAAIVPRRYRCVPASSADATRVRLQFTSMRFGDPGYGQLTLTTATEIRTGADDDSEMGAFHFLHQPQREADLRVRLQEYLRFGLEAGIFYST
jgi:hypothetical protein